MRNNLNFVSEIHINYIKKKKKALSRTLLLSELWARGQRKRKKEEGCKQNILRNL